MSLQDIATIVVSSTGAGVTRQGYGIVGIVSHTAAWAERFRPYTSVAGVGADFAVNTPEYLAAQKAFASSPRVPAIKVMRAALVPQQAFQIGIVTPAVRQPYQLRVAVPTGVVFPSQDALYISAGATGWAPSGVWSRGDLIANDVSATGPAGPYMHLYSCLGPSGAGPAAGFTGVGGASGPIGITGTYRDNGVYWAWVGTGGTGTITNDAVTYGLKSRIEALGAPTAIGTGINQMAATITGGALSRGIQLQANTAGKFFGLQVYNRAALSIAQTHADAGIATDLAAINLATKAWYGLVTLYNSKAIVEAAAAWVESNTKLYAAATLDSACATVTESSSATDVGHDIKAAAYARTWAFHHPSNDQFVDAAEFGKFFPVSPGGETWRMKTLAGVTVEAYTEAELTNLRDRYMHYYYDVGGVNVVGGDAMTGAGEFIDTVRGLDWYTSELQAKLANLVISQWKVPMTNPGIDSVAAKVRQQNKAGIVAGLIREGTDTVTVPDIADISTEDKLARELAGVSSQFDLAQAIHHITVNVTANV